MPLGEIEISSDPKGIVARISWWQVSLVLFAIGMGVFSVWRTTDKLGTRVDVLTTAISRLEKTIDGTDNWKSSVESRLSQIEAKTAHGVPPKWFEDRVSHLELEIEDIKREHRVMSK